MEIIVPAAGLSTRFPGTKPKYLLYDYEHMMMLKRAVLPYIGKCGITVGILREHDLKYNASTYIRKEIPDVKVCILPEPTRGPAETVYDILVAGNFEDSAPFMVRDCDSFFDHDDMEGNYVCVSDIADHDVLKKLYAKSFVRYNNQGIITDIVEKSVISNTFCVGGYKFESVGLYKHCFAKTKQSSEVFVSHVIYHALAEGNLFKINEVYEYVDVGTAEDWFDYNDRPVIFCDIDGTIIEAQGRYGKNSFDDDPIPLAENVKRLLELQKKGAQLIFVTARPKTYMERTQELLKLLGFSPIVLISGVNNSKRIIINDYNDANPYPRAISINIPRNSDTLKDFL